MNEKGKAIINVVTFIVLLFALNSGTSYAQDSTGYGEGGVIPGSLVVEFHPEVISLPGGVLKVAPDSSTVSVPAVLETMNSIGTVQIEKLFPSAVPGRTEVISPITGQLVQIKDLSQYFTVKFDTQVPVQNAVSLFRALPVVKSATPDYRTILDEVPNDTLFNLQWHLENTVNPKFDINAMPAWDLSKGDDIKIAFIEKGVRDDHEDLQGHIWYGAGSEIGFDTTSPGGRHGTYVAGLAAAVTNNDTGIAGVAWNGKIVPRIGSGTIGKAQDIDSSAWVAGAHVINNSWHTLSSDPDLPYLEDAIRNAFNLGAVITASMGNNQHPRPYIAYPAAYDSFVVAVGVLEKVNDGDSLKYAWFQNWGSFIDVTAPGNEVFTTSPRNWNPAYGYYTYVSGTSFSTPQVSGLAALILSINPDITNVQVMDIIRNSAFLFNGWELDFDHYGYGIIDAYEALKYTLENYGGTLPRELTLSGEWNIRDGATLTIEPGSNITFEPDASLIISNQGKLEILGTESDPVIFTGAGKDPNWIYDYNNGYFNGDYDPYNVSALITLVGEEASPPSPNLEISHTVFRQTGTAVKMIDYGSPGESYYTRALIDNVEIQEVNVGMVLGLTGTVYFEDVNVSNSNIGFYMLPSYGDYFGARFVIADNDCGFADIPIEGSAGSFHNPDFDLTNCTFYNNADYDVFWRYDYEIDIDAFRTDYLLRNSIFAYSGGFRFNSAFVTYSLWYDLTNPPPDNIGIIPNENPLFVDPGVDFHLQAGSPCIDAGELFTCDPDQTIVDMGAFYFHQEEGGDPCDESAFILTEE